MTRPVAESRVPVIAVPEIRDYQRINAELIQSLEAGAVRVRLAGAEGQRSLAAGLAGPWNAVVEVEGYAGPELAAEMDAPNLTVVCFGEAADGAGQALRAGRLVILGDTTDALGYSQSGGAIVASAGVGARAGLNQSGGVLAAFGSVGRLAGERQSGGWFFASDDELGPYTGHGRRGGHFVSLALRSENPTPIDSAAAKVLHGLAVDVGGWLPPDLRDAIMKIAGGS
jgi:glutamate synthase domain-containing protein 3